MHAHAARGAALNLGLAALAQTAQSLHEGAAHLPAHEVAHLREMNHSAAFWRTVATLVPDYAERRAALRRNASRYLLL